MTMKKYTFVLISVLLQLALLWVNFHLAVKGNLPVRYFYVRYSYRLGDTTSVWHSGPFMAIGPADYDFIITLIKNGAGKPVSSCSIYELKEISQKEYQADTTTVKVTRKPVEFKTI